MHSRLRLSAALAMGLTLWTGTALAQVRPVCEKNTPQSLGGEIIKVDAAQGKVTVRQSDGTMHEFQASKETIQSLKVGSHIEAKLREAPGC